MLRISEGKRMVKYAFVGGLNTGVDFAVFCIMVYGIGMGLFWAQALAYGAGLMNSYFLNRRWTFQSQEKQSARELVRFILINVLSFGLATAVLLSLEHWQVAPLLAKLFSIGASLIVNYMGYRLWVFTGTDQQIKQAN